MTVLHLVRHGRPEIDPATPASTWPLATGAYDEVVGWSHGLPAGARWATSPEPKARATAALLHPGPLDIVDGLAEHRREAGWISDFPGTVERAFAASDQPAAPGWEPLDACRDRVLAAVQELLAAAPGEDLVLVGHGTAWTVLVATLTGRGPDLDRWRSLGMPDLVASLEVPTIIG